MKNPLQPSRCRQRVQAAGPGEQQVESTRGILNKLNSKINEWSKVVHMHHVVSWFQQQRTTNTRETVWEDYEKSGSHDICFCQFSPPAQEPSRSSCKANWPYVGQDPAGRAQGSATWGATSTFSNGYLCGLWPDRSSCRSTPRKQTKQLRQKFIFKVDIKLRFSQKLKFLPSRASNFNYLFIWIFFFFFFF